MKLAVVVFLILPVALAAVVNDKRFLLEDLLGGFNILDLAKDVVCQFGTDESEESCELAICPQVLALVGLDHVALLSEPLCALVCEEAQAITNTFVCPQK